jgi:hypothetical protein
MVIIRSLKQDQLLHTVMEKFLQHNDDYDEITSAKYFGV